MSTRMSFFWNLAAARRLGGRKWTLFFLFWLWDFKEDDSWQMHRSWWPLVLFEDLDWIGGWCSSTTCHLSPSQSTAERTPEGVRHVTWPQENEKLCPSFSHVFYLISALLVENSRLLINAFMVGGSSGPCEFPWEWLICPLLQKGDVVQPFHFLALPRQGSHMTWPTVNLDSWNPKASTLFFLCVLCPFFLLWSCYWVEELYQPCLPAGEIKNLQCWV